MCVCGWVGVCVVGAVKRRHFVFCSVSDCEIVFLHACLCSTPVEFKSRRPAITAGYFMDVVFVIPNFPTQFYVSQCSSIFFGINPCSIGTRFHTICLDAQNKFLKALF
ncbi:hypothetical protein XENOCAPTIV_021802 [Xenoophorus captivus]|uniref:Secreted protein n=1 Tax=Xenoophorus captivus TaxID=1517983 RepID=A0ABV0RUL7_9TELE